MNRRLIHILLVLCFVFASLQTISAHAAPPPGKGRPPVAFDTNETPLEKAIKAANLETAKKKKDKLPGGEKKDKCQAAIDSGDPDDIAKWCDVAKAHFRKVGDQNFHHPDGKAAGKRVVTQTTLEFDSPNQKGRPDDPPVDKWPSTKLKAFERVKDHLPGPVTPSGPDGRGGRTLGSAVLPSSADNDDKDCVDWVTGQHFGGMNVPDGSASSCFDTTGKLIATLTSNGDGTCTHRDGSVFFGDATDGVEDDCWDDKDVLKTTLVESIDEDGPESLDNDGDGLVNEDAPDGINNDDDCIAGDGTIFRGAICSTGKGKWGEELRPLIDEDGPDSVDDDGDGLLNEDGPAVQAEDDCARLYRKAGLTPMAGDKDASGQCDVGRALVKFVNDEAKKRPGGKPLFKAKDDGTFDPDATDGIEPGKESRKVTITESFGVKCKRGTTFVDGVCVPDDELAAAGGPEKFHAAMRLITGVGPVRTDAADSPDIARVAMMGFTFAPPVIEWGYRINEEVCILGICVEIFYARIGYEFDLAVGLRLPVEIKVLDAPESVLAGHDVTLNSQLEPLDFTTSQFEQFCNHHHLDRDWFIGGGGGLSPCRRFGFTDFLDDMVPFIGDDKKDGDEFVARYSVFAGVIVRVFGIPLFNWGIDSSLDVPAACTMMRIIQVLEDAPEEISVDQIAALVKLLMGIGDLGTTEDAAIGLVNFIKEVAGSCGTFTTPFGEDENGLRTFPFSGEYNIRADCAEAMARGEVITIKGKPRPICTNMILGISGASLGIGLGLEASVGSKLITGDFATAEDSTGSGTDVKWTKSANETGSAVDITVHADNYDPADHHDTARISLDSFTYYLNALQVTLKATLQFGGILSPIPDIGSFPIYSFIIDTGTFGIPIPQHPGTGAVAIDVPVENYGLKVDVKPESADPAVRIDDKTLLIAPGEPGPYAVRVRNIGSRTGAFDNFRVALSNRPDQTSPYRFGIDPNTDHDCVAVGSSCIGGIHFRGDPYDGITDACYDGAGAVLAGKAECIDEDPPSTVEGLSREQRDDDGDGIPDEDPPEAWVTSPDGPAFGALTIAGVEPYVFSSLPPAPAGQSLRISLNPFRHPLTRPGIYPFAITADSIEAKAKDMAHTDPSGNFRVDAVDVGFVKVKSFFEPQVVVLPNFDGGKPGTSRNYRIEGTNGGNVNDSMSVATSFLDFNQASCTLTTLGRLPAGTDPGCPYRAVPTVVPPAWNTAAGVTPVLPPAPAALEPLGSSSATFNISVPRDWAGMVDTTYRFRVTTVSQNDPADPRATRNFVAKHTVVATKESMTRYIGLEIADATATLVAADNAGVKLGGLKPIVMKPITQMNDSALTAVLAGNFAKASNNHATSIQLVQAFVKALEGGGKSLPPALFTDLQNRAAAMIADMTAAEASTVTSAP